MKKCSDWTVNIHKLPDYEYRHTVAKNPFPEDYEGDLNELYTFRRGGDEVIEGMIQVVENGKIGYCDRYGRLVIPCKYDWAGIFDSSLCIVKKNGFYGLIDREGHMVVFPRHIYLGKYMKIPSRAFKLASGFLVDLPAAAATFGIPSYPFQSGERCLLMLGYVYTYQPDATLTMAKATN